MSRSFEHASASRLKRAMIVWSDELWGCRILRATSRPVAICLPRNTAPKPPSPILSSMRYRWFSVRPMRFSTDWAGERMAAGAGLGAAAGDGVGLADTTGAGAATARAGAPPAAPDLADWNSVMAADSRPPVPPPRPTLRPDSGLGSERDRGRIVPEMSPRRACWGGATAFSASGETAGSAGGSTFLPQAPQNRAPVSSSVAQCGQRDIAVCPRDLLSGCPRARPG